MDSPSSSLVKEVGEVKSRYIIRKKPLQMEAIMLIYKFIATTIERTNGTNMPTAINNRNVSLPNSVKALCDNAKT